MTEISKKVNSILKDLETKLNNKQDIEFAKQKFLEVCILFTDEMEKLAESFETRLEYIAQNQSVIVEKINKIESSVDEFVKDIYDEDLYDFEIDCPYCNNQFVAEIQKQSNEIKCPDCNNVIELDWNGKGPEDDDHDGCGCGHCHHDCEDCGDEEIEEDDM